MPASTPPSEPEVIGQDAYGFSIFASDPTPPPGYVSDDGKVHEWLDGLEPAIDLGEGFALSGEERPRWLHTCGVLRPDGKRTARVRFWCGLAPGHVVTRSERGVTIRASILCHRCGAHGFVTDSRWASC